MRCGPVPDVFVTVDFGPSRNGKRETITYCVRFAIFLSVRFSASQCFNYLKAVQKRGPLVNSEFYAGWLAHWEESMPAVNTDQVVRSMRDMLTLNASFNFYMFHGGTNFGFTSGANKYENLKRPKFVPQITSYDYDAPLDEAGDPTEKYFKIKNVLAEHVSLGEQSFFNRFG